MISKVRERGEASPKRVPPAEEFTGALFFGVGACTVGKRNSRMIKERGKKKIRLRHDSSTHKI